MTLKSNHSTYAPPAMPGYHSVGWIHSAHGIRGELYFRTYAGGADWADRAQALYLLFRGEDRLTNLSIKRMTAHKEGFILKLEGVNDRNRAEEIAKSLVYIEEALLESAPGEPVFLKQLQDFELVDKEHRRLGIVTGFASNGPQDLLRVRVDGAKDEALVPLVDDFLVNIDLESRRIIMDLPPGLLNLEDE